MAAAAGTAAARSQGDTVHTLDIDERQRRALTRAEPTLWLNPHYGDAGALARQPECALLDEAEARLARAAPLLASLFPELERSDGLIESPLRPALADAATGRLLLKLDSHLPVAGSIKARGGIHEVLCLAEQLAIESGLLTGPDDDYRKLAEPAARAHFGRTRLAVGSTGNLGLSIGIAGSALGFDTTVHMSSDAKAWKKQRLRDRGVSVVEHPQDYGAAVAAGRAQAEGDAASYFVDDERSSKLFMGYAVAARRLQRQLQALDVAVDAEHPLFVYLPAGVGGAPGGICYGLKQLFGEHVHCFFAEPVQAPCMMLGYATPAGREPTSVYELGLAIDTDADGLAVGRAAPWVCEVTRALVSGVYTATDAQLYRELLTLHRREGLDVEPSAAIACLGPGWLASPRAEPYLTRHGLSDKLTNATHIAWLTGGSLVPPEEYARYLDKAHALARPK